jgi:aspartate/methionine/tyrosine aminotransferase
MLKLVDNLERLGTESAFEILARADALARQGKSIINLGIGQPDFKTPQHIVEAAIKAVRDGRTGYPNNQGEPALRETVSEKIARQNGLNYSPAHEILITSGATFGIYAALAAVLDPGDQVIVPDPIYDAYHSPIALLGAEARPVACAIRDGRFALDAQPLADACTDRTRAILLNTPWNPTGTVLRREELAAIMEVAQARELVVLSDEIYEAIVYEGHEHLSPASLDESARRRTIIVNSFSKTYSMTGWRLGYCAGPAELVRAMYLVLQQSSRGPATFIQDAGAAALSGPQDCVAVMREEYARRLAQVRASLAGLPRIELLIPEGGFFAILDVRRLGVSSDELRRRLLHEFGVVVIHGAAYGRAGEGTLRVSFASGGMSLELGLSRLRAGLEQLAGQYA